MREFKQPERWNAEAVDKLTKKLNAVFKGFAVSHEDFRQIQDLLDEIADKIDELSEQAYGDDL